MKKTLIPLLFLFVGAAHAAGDVSRGADVFDEECAECHSVNPGKNKKGPSLAGVIGRQAGTYPGFAKYSDAMKASGITWTADKIKAYIYAPKKVVPGGRMKYDGLEDLQDREDVIAFLAKPD